MEIVCCCFFLFSLSFALFLASASACCLLKLSISSSIADFSSFCFFLCSNIDVSESFTEKNIGPSSASHCGSTDVAHCMYSFVVNISSWYTT
ncbi:hypothetical protein HanXRQr2_Chr12g0564471 [Helianthus annuus]|uniref:Secreted protein n=1 Tax=Helianthus annuus TaxID=4232 RepID=A0A9K3HKA7_HELAN|nr:hypothetical protein HanXRQr2_Chr12g0564471 [Helianthus annuus]